MIPTLTEYFFKWVETPVLSLPTFLWIEWGFPNMWENSIHDCSCRICRHDVEVSPKKKKLNNVLFLFVIKAFFLEKVHLEPAMIHGSCKEATRELLLLPLRSVTSIDRCMTRSCHLWTLLLLGASSSEILHASLANWSLDGGNSNIFYFHPEPWGRWTHFDDHIFQMGWNHQLGVVRVIFCWFLLIMEILLEILTFEPHQWQWSAPAWVGSAYPSNQGWWL